jgi:hypothetical protein
LAPTCPNWAFVRLKAAPIRPNSAYIRPELAPTCPNWAFVRLKAAPTRPN